LGKKRKAAVVGISTGEIPANATTDLMRKHKSIPGYGTDAGLYRHPFPDIVISHFKEAVASEPHLKNPKITIVCGHNEIIRYVVFLNSSYSSTCIIIFFACLTAVCNYGPP